ncbi:SIS domain-containing protein, partial [Streptomyces massasporeus]
MGDSAGESKLAGQFFDAAIGLLQQVRDGDSAEIAAAGAAIAEAVANGNRLFAFGAGHSSLAAQDVVYRAGGLALMNLLVVPGASRAPRRPSAECTAA